MVHHSRNRWSGYSEIFSTDRNMKIAIYSLYPFERDYLLQANNGKHELILIEEFVTDHTVKFVWAVKLLAFL